LFLSCISTISSAQNRSLIYLFIDTLVTFGDKHAIAVNGQIPMPTLTFTEGDIAEIYVHNEVQKKAQLHWHSYFTKQRGWRS
jgi:hypothetical protein